MMTASTASAYATVFEIDHATRRSNTQLRNDHTRLNAGLG